MRRVSQDVRGLIDLGPESKANGPGQGAEDFCRIYGSVRGLLLGGVSA